MVTKNIELKLVGNTDDLSVKATFRIECQSAAPIVDIPNITAKRLNVDEKGAKANTADYINIDAFDDVTLTVDNNEVRVVGSACSAFGKVVVNILDLGFMIIAVPDLTTYFDNRFDGKVLDLDGIIINTDKGSLGLAMKTSGNIDSSGLISGMKELGHLDTKLLLVTSLSRESKFDLSNCVFDNDIVKEITLKGTKPIQLIHLGKFEDVFETKDEIHQAMLIQSGLNEFRLLSKSESNTGELYVPIHF